MTQTNENDKESNESDYDELESDHNYIEQLLNELQVKQIGLHKRLDALLYFESILSSIYSGVSTVAIKIFVDSLADSSIS